VRGNAEETVGKYLSCALGVLVVTANEARLRALRLLLLLLVVVIGHFGNVQDDSSSKAAVLMLRVNTK
jgi:hypothetical protein